MTPRQICGIVAIACTAIMYTLSATVIVSLLDGAQEKLFAAAAFTLLAVIIVAGVLGVTL